MGWEDASVGCNAWVLSWFLALGKCTRERRVLGRSEHVCLCVFSSWFYWFWLGLHSSAKEGGGRSLQVARLRQAAHAGPAWVQRNGRVQGRQVGGCAVDRVGEEVSEKKGWKTEKRGGRTAVGEGGK